MVACVRPREVDTRPHRSPEEGGPRAGARAYTMEGVGAMLIRTDPFRELDRLSQQLFGQQSPGTWSRPSPMPIDAYRAGEEFVVEFDLPGVSAEAIELE